MKHIARIAVTTALALAGATAAQAQYYVEGAYTATRLKDEGEKIKPAMLTGVVGYGLHPHLAVEGMLGLGVKKVASLTKMALTKSSTSRPMAST